MDIGSDATGDAVSDSDAVWMTYSELAVARGTDRRSAIRLAQRHRWRRQPGNDQFARILVPRSMLQPAEPRSDVVPDVAERRTRDTAPDVVRAVAAFDRSVAALTEQLMRERVRGDKAEAVADDLRAQLAEARIAADGGIEALEVEVKATRGRADRSDAALSGERQRSDELRERLDALTGKLAAAQEQTEMASDRAEALQARTDGLVELWKAAEAAADEARQQVPQAAETAEDVLRADDARRRQGLLARLRAARRGEWTN